MKCDQTTNRVSKTWCEIQVQKLIQLITIKIQRCGINLFQVVGLQKAKTKVPIHNSILNEI